MKTFLFGTASAVAALCAAPALAQDTAPPAESAFAGPYVGMQIGRSKLESIHSDSDYYYNGEKDGTTLDRRVTFGLRAGYDFVSGPLIAGALAEVNFGKFDSFKAPYSDGGDEQYAIGTRVSRYGSVRGKIGLTDGNLAAFVTAGLARSNARQRFSEIDEVQPDFFSNKGDRSGTVIGLGVDYAIGRSNIGLDYSEYRFGTRSQQVIEGFDGSGSGNFYDMRYNLKSLSLTYAYRFGGSGVASAAPASSAFSGPYVGLRVGMGEMNAKHRDLDYWYDGIDRGVTTDRNGLVGFQLGYDHLIGNLLVGGLAEVNFGKLNSFQSVGADPGDLTYGIGVRTSRVGSVRAKGGFVSGNLAAYGTVGFARSDATMKFREEDGSDQLFDGKGDRSGYVVGIGAAYALGQGSSLGLDYSEYRFGKQRSQLRNSDGTPQDYFFDQHYKVRAISLVFNYGF